MSKKVNGFKIVVAGMGYVGLSNAILLGQHNEVIAYDIDVQKVNMINEGKSPIKDKDIQLYLENKSLRMKATYDLNIALNNADYAVLAIPTDYCAKSDSFDTKELERLISQIININPNVYIIVKSTVPVGFTNEMINKLNYEKLTFSPEFLREGTALNDNLYPSRVIMGGKSKECKVFSKLLIQGAKKKDVTVLYLTSSEAEAVKLFSNSYLALRVAFFNELDSFADSKSLSTRNVIKGMSLDSRIGDYYNNPSFGYGGYCLPKDTKQLLSSFKGVPKDIMLAIVESNRARKQYIINKILEKKPKKVGIYRLTMKKNSDNFRESASNDILEGLLQNNLDVVIYEPNCESDNYKGIEVSRDINEFKKKSDIIIANRISSNLSDVQSKVYSRDIYLRD